MTATQAPADANCGRTSHPIDLHVGAKIRMRRKLVGMSQETLAAALGITFQQIQKYERGANRISASKMVEAARALQVTPAHFFDGLNFEADAVDDDAPTPVELLGGVAGGMELARMFAALPRDDRRLVLELAERLTIYATRVETALNGASARVDASDVRNQPIRRVA